MQKIAGEYLVDIYTDTTFALNSTDNINSYDAVYMDQTEHHISTKIGIKIYKGDNVVKSAFITGVGGATGIYANSVISNTAEIILCCGDAVFCFSVPNLEFLWRTKADQYTCFEVYEYQDSYIVHGELEISRLDKNGNILWQHGGADIFVTLDGTPDFKLTANCIVAVDFTGQVYYIGYDGSILE